MLASSAATRHGARAAYAAGVDTFYAQHGSHYHNPHEPLVRTLVMQVMEQLFVDNVEQQQQPLAILDLAAGSGEVSRAVLAWHAMKLQQQQHDDDKHKKTFPRLDLNAMDPFTAQAYETAVGRPCLDMSFADIAAQGLPRQYDVVICSFALHLCPAPSLLYAVCVQLAMSSAKYLVILTPHKRPHITAAMGWTLQEEVVQQKVRRRTYVNNGMFTGE